MSKFLADCSAPGPLTDEHSAAYDFVETMRPHAATEPYVPILWHGWALREAFMQGIEWERRRVQEDARGEAAFNDRD
jgi:hypothetical protein